MICLCFLAQRLVRDWRGKDEAVTKASGHSSRMRWPCVTLNAVTSRAANIK